MFKILDIHISWRHQMPRHKTRITFYWITWEVNTVVNEFGQFMSYHKRKGLISKISTKTAAWKLVPDPIVFAKNQTPPLLKMKILKQATYIRYVVAKLLRFLQISMQTL